MSQPDDKYFTPMYMELKDMAEKQWVDFCRLIGDEAMLAAIVCMLKNRGHSMGRISNNYNLTKRKVQIICEKKCYCEFPYIAKSGKLDIQSAKDQS